MPELPAFAVLLGLHNPREGQASQAVQPLGKGVFTIAQSPTEEQNQTAWESPRHLPAKQGAP